MSLFDRIFNRKKEPLEIPYERIAELLDNLHADVISIDNLQANKINPSGITLTVEQIHKGIDYLKEGSA